MKPYKCLKLTLASYSPKCVDMIIVTLSNLHQAYNIGAVLLSFAATS